MVPETGGRALDWPVPRIAADAASGGNVGLLWRPGSPLRNVRGDKGPATQSAGRHPAGTGSTTNEAGVWPVAWSVTVAVQALPPWVSGATA